MINETSMRVMAGGVNRLARQLAEVVDAALSVPGGSQPVVYVETYPTPSGASIRVWLPGYFGPDSELPAEVSLSYTVTHRAGDRTVTVTSGGGDVSLEEDPLPDALDATDFQLWTLVLARRGAPPYHMSCVSVDDVVRECANAWHQRDHHEDYTWTPAAILGPDGRAVWSSGALPAYPVTLGLTPRLRAWVGSRIDPPASPPPTAVTTGRTGGHRYVRQGDGTWLWTNPTRESFDANHALRLVYDWRTLLARHEALYELPDGVL